MTPPAIKLMPDYQCWPLWHYKSKKTGNIDPRQIFISDELADDLESWALIYESHLNWGDPPSTKWTEEEEIQFNIAGRRLCIRLAEEVDGRFSVFYYDIKSARCFPASALT